MEREETLYTMKEISTATGIKVNTLQGRRKRLGIEANRGGYPLAAVKRTIKKPPQKKAVFSQRKDDALRQMLKNDGAL